MKYLRSSQRTDSSIVKNVLKYPGQGNGIFSVTFDTVSSSKFLDLFLAGKRFVHCFSGIKGITFLLISFLGYGILSAQTPVLFPTPCSDNTVYFSAHADAQTGPSGLTQLFSYIVGSSTPVVLGTPTTSFNSIALDPVTRLMYGISGQTLVSIDATGVVTPLGTITGSGFASSTNWVAATFLSTGELIIRPNTALTSPVYKIDINTLTATVLSTGLTARVSDMVYDSMTNLIYATYNTTLELVSIDPSSGAVNVIGVTSPPIAGPSAGMFTDAVGNIYSVVGTLPDYTVYRLNKTTAASIVAYTFDPSVLSNMGFDAAGCSLAAILPVNFVSFAGSCEGTFHKIDWSTASEVNSRDFTLIRSVDGTHWTNVAVVSSLNANSDSVQHYTYLVRDTGDTDVTYYKLRQTDHDGKVTDSRTIVVFSCLVRDTDDVFGFYPNPGEGGNIQVTAKEDGFINISNRLGQQLRKKEVRKGTQSIFLGDLPTDEQVLLIRFFDTSDRLRSTHKFMLGN